MMAERYVFLSLFVILLVSHDILREQRAVDKSSSQLSHSSESCLEECNTDSQVSIAGPGVGSNIRKERERGEE